MPNAPSVYQSLCDRLGVEEQHRSKLFWASIAGAPLVWWVLSSRSRPKSAPDTRINAFFKNKDTAPQQVTQQAKRKATGFHSFLKEVPQSHRDASSFSAFLKPQGCNQAAVTDSSPSPEAPQGPDAADVIITILFGTEYGFSKEVAERAAAAIKACGSYWVKLLDMADHPEGADLSKEQAVLVVCSTQGDGVAPTEARDFCDWLESDAAPALSTTHYAVCALGDKSYEHFCACGKQLDKRFAALGAKRFADRLDVNKEDLPSIDQWLSKVTRALPSMPLKACQELGGGTTKQSHGGTAKPKRWGKSRPFLGQVVAVEGLCQLASSEDKDTIRVEVDLGESSLQYTPGDALGVYPLNCSQAVDEVLQVIGQDGALQVPCPSWHYQDQGSQAQPSPGDSTRQLPLAEALTKCYDLRSPKPELLQLLFQHLPTLATDGSHSHQNGRHNGHLPHANGHRLAPNGNKHVDNGHNDHANGHQVEENGQAPKGNGSQQTANGHSSIGSQDGKHAEPSSSNSDHSSVQEAASKQQPAVQVDGQTDDISKDAVRQQAADLQDLLQEEVEAYLDKRHIIDILHDFSGSHPPLVSLLSCLRPLQPRLYSISSSQQEHPARVQITVAVVRYQALGRERIGVTSTFLKERMQALVLQIGDKVPMYVAKNPDFRLPKSLSTPIIMVGPGTGLAPFRAFMQERLHAQQSSGLALGQSVLFFGCRRADQDYLYGQQLKQWAQQGSLTLCTAFSRQQKQKVYVQDRLRENAELVWRLLQDGGHFYVCGDAAHMAGSVEQALLHIISHHQGDGGSASADEYLEGMKQQGRYQRDVWF